MALSDLIILYDVPIEVDGKVSTPNTWKARYALNFKGVGYKTVWIEYPDVESTMRSLGVAPTGRNPNGSPHYVLPVIADPSRRTASGGPTTVSGSWRIAEYLDNAYPSPGPLFPEGTKALQAVYLDHFFSTVMRPSMPILLPDIHGRLHERSRPYYRVLSEMIIGVALENMCPLGSLKREETWAAIHNGFTSFAAVLDDVASDPNGSVTGKVPTFSDLAVAAFLETLFLLHPEEWNAKIRTWHGGRWEKLRRTCVKWKNVHQDPPTHVRSLQRL